MKPLALLTLLACVVISSTGCCLTGHCKRSSKAHCDGRHCAAVAPAGAAVEQGANLGQVAYPYYTVRGPRDFLQQF